MLDGLAAGQASQGVDLGAMENPVEPALRTKAAKAPAADVAEEPVAGPEVTEAELTGAAAEDATAAEAAAEEAPAAEAASEEAEASTEPTAS